MLASENAAVINACRFALMNAAPEEWREKPAVDPDESEDPFRLFAKQLMGTAIRPRLPESNIVEQVPVASHEVRPQQCVTIDEAL